MINDIFKFRIPTILGLGVIVIGLGVGVYLTLQNQIILTKAAPQIKPENIFVSNIEETSVTISWTTQQKAIGLVKFGLAEVDEEVVLDTRDTKGPTARSLHYATISNLVPQTTYQYKIVSGKFESVPTQFTTAKQLIPNNLKPITGSVLDENQPLSDGLVYLKIPDKEVLSTTIKSLGNFIIPLTFLSIQNNTSAKLEIISEDGRVASATINLINEGPIGPLRLGQDLDLSKQIIKASINSQYDLNNDGVVNTSDYAIAVKNLNLSTSKLTDKRVDINGDGIVDKKDTDLILSEIQKSGNK